MRLVLLSCCAPCSAGAIKQLADGQIPDVDDFVRAPSPARGRRPAMHRGRMPHARTVFAMSP